MNTKIKDFISGHIIAGTLITFGLLALTYMGYLFTNQQVGINPTEFVLKAFGKIFYCGLALILTHVVVKFLFTTVYCFCKWTYPDAANPLKGTSGFREAWVSYCLVKEATPPVGDFNAPVWDHRITMAITVHVGVFASICLLLALAF